MKRPTTVSNPNTIFLSVSRRLTHIALLRDARSLLLWHTDAPLYTDQGHRSRGRRLDLSGLHTARKPSCLHLQAVEESWKSRLTLCLNFSSTWRPRLDSVGLRATLRQECGLSGHHPRSIFLATPQAVCERCHPTRLNRLLKTFPCGNDANSELTDEEACVRGTFVRGLRRNDVMALDAFEGDVS